MKDKTSGSISSTTPITPISPDEATGESIIRDNAKQQLFVTPPDSDQGVNPPIRYRDIALVVTTVAVVGTIFIWLYTNILKPIDNLDYRVAALEEDRTIPIDLPPSEPTVPLTP